MIDDLENVKRVLIFRKSNILFVSENGNAEKSFWELIDDKTLLIGIKDQNLLLKFKFLDDLLAVFKIDGLNSFSHWINEVKTGRDIDTIDDLLSFFDSKQKEVLKKEREINKQQDEFTIKIEKKELNRKIERWNNSIFIDSNDIREIHCELNKYILFGDDYYKNIITFRNKYGFDLISRIVLISNSYSVVKKMVWPLIEKGIVEESHPHKLINNNKT